MARRRMAKRKRVPASSKYAKTVMVDAQAMRQLQVYRYPFSVATSQPKIPDGCNTQTVGVKCQSQMVITGKHQLYILSPIYGLIGTVRYGADANTGFYQTARPTQSILKSFQPPTGENAPTDKRVDNETGFCAYRLVSCGMRLKNISNDNENYGYWEAIRFNASDIGLDFSMLLTGGPLSSTPTNGGPDVEYGQVGQFRLHEETINKLFAKTNWLNHPTYQMGKLKSLSQFEFRLSPQVDEHKFIDIPKYMEFKADEYGEDSPWEPMLGDGFDAKHLHAWGMDTSFDFIAVSCTGITGTQILAHFCANYELKGDAMADKNIYSTETTNAGMALKAKQIDFKVRDRLPGHYLAGPRS